MARAPDPRIEQAKELFDNGLKLIDIAKQLDVSEGTVRSWKSRYNWNATLQSEKRNVAKKKQEKKRIVADDVETVCENSELTDKQRLFCVLYVRCFNATKAYQKAYQCGYDVANAEGYKLLVNPCIKSEIHRLKQNRLNREMLDEHDIFQKYMDIAFADITDFVEFGQETVYVMGAFGPVQIENSETGEKEYIQKKVNTVRFKEHTDVDGTLISEIKQGKDGASIKLADRMKALQWLTDHMYMATEEQKARIDKIRADTEAIKRKSELNDEDEIADDGFLEALNSTAAEDWADEEG